MRSPTCRPRTRLPAIGGSNQEVTDVDHGNRTDPSVVRDPRVYLVGRQTVDDAALAEFLADHGVRKWSTDTEVAGEKLIEVAGRLCYMSFSKPRPGGNAAYVGHILEVGHGSVLEHSVYNLIITGVSRSFTHELVRHRAGFGFSQLSQRFVDESSCSFVEPDAIADDPELHRVWLETVGVLPARLQDPGGRPRGEVQGP